jgi:hypothetical protein
MKIPISNTTAWGIKLPKVPKLPELPLLYEMISIQSVISGA